MFRVIESLFIDPIRFPIKPGVCLYPGNVVSLVDYNGNFVIDLCEGNVPFGLIGNRCFGRNTLDFKYKAKVYHQRMIVDLNKFDRKNNIIIGSSLYCSEHGILTSKKPSENAFVLAKVITPANSEKSHMQILWL